MRYSPYEMSDYGLQYQGGSVVALPLTPVQRGGRASIPELDDYRSLQYEVFDGYRAITSGFPQSLTVDTPSETTELLLSGRILSGHQSERTPKRLPRPRGLSWISV